jgi:hypothetical protein
MEAISFALGGVGDAVCSFLIPVSCSRGALWVAPSVSTSVVSMEGTIHKLFSTVCERKGRAITAYGMSVRVSGKRSSNNMMQMSNEASHFSSRNPNANRNL